MQRYMYEPIEDGLDTLAKQAGTDAALRAVARLKFAVLANAWTEYDVWHAQADMEDCLAKSWEDLRIALSGYGDSALTGAVIHFWTAVGQDLWEEGKRTMNRAVMASEAQTPKSVARGYLAEHRNKAVRLPSEGYDLPALVPVRGKRLRAWATANGLPPAQVEEKMALVEEYERLGLLDLKTEGFFLGYGGDEVQVEDDEAPMAASGGAPFLTLVKG